MKVLPSFTIFFLILFCSFSLSAEETFAIKLLEKKFIEAENFEITYKHKDVPKDIIKRFWKGFPEKKIKMANIGESFNSTCLFDMGMPMSQHQYTVFTEDFAATLIKEGGLLPGQILILTDRRSSGLSCEYHIKYDLENYKAIQSIFKHNGEMKQAYLLSNPKCSRLEE